MEKKQLDLDQPLLSVRRFSSKLASLNGANGTNKKKIEKSVPHKQHSLPLYKSDWELGEVTKPAAVPFIWEQIPGKPKGGNEAKAAQSPVEPSTTPRLPPGRAFDVPKRLSGEVPPGRAFDVPKRLSGDVPKRLSGEVPPGRAFDVPKRHSGEIYEYRYAFKSHIEASPQNDVATLWESLKKRVNAEGDTCDSKSEGDDYSDALDTLSPTEMLSMRCSDSGLSGYGGSDMKPCGSFSADIQTRDFMMKRFLPAAKAMVLDTPQYVPKKQPMTPERPRPVKKAVSGEMRQPLLEQKRATIVPHYGKYKEDRESEGERDEIDDSRKKSVKAFGLFSRFCLKNSLCLLNPVPGMKTRTRVPTSSPKEVSRMARTAYSGPLTQIADKHSSGPVYKHKLDPRSHSQELYKVKTKLNGESNRLCYSGDLHTMKGSSPPSRFIRGGISPYRNKAPPSPFRGGARFLGVANDVENVKAISDISSRQRYKQASGSMTPAVEKTLYIDCVKVLEQSLSESISSGTESRDSGKDLVTSVDGSRMEDNAIAESFVRDITRTDTLEGGSKSMTALGSVDGVTPSSARISNVGSQVDRMEELRLDQGRDKKSGPLDCSKLKTNGVNDANNERILKEDGQGNGNVSSMLSPLPPPLPKSPSESWLWRTLPSISPRHQKKQQHAKDSNTGTKWETIVKTSNVRHDHARYSEELVPHVSQHSKSSKRRDPV